jgi:peptide-N-glycosidase F-like protein
MRGAIVGALAAIVVIGSCDDGDETESAATTATTASVGAGAGGQGGSGGTDPAAVCAELDLPVLPFAGGPFGTHRGELADDFEVALVDGSTFRLSERWSGCETYLFVPDSLPVSQLDLTSIWDKDDLDDLVAASPLNTHYFFVSRQTMPEAADAATQAMQGRIDALLGTLEPTAAEHWRTHLHVIAGPATSWLGGVISGHGRIGFGIDRSQRIRGIGYLSDVERYDAQLQQQGAWPWESNLAYVANEARYFNAQHDRLADRTGGTVVTLWDGEILEEFAETTVALPPPEEMTTFDTLEVEVEMQCPDPELPEPGNCGPWDYLANLYVKDAMNADVEIARFITSYHRETHWIVDVTPMLAHLLSGGMQTFRWSFAPAWNTQPTATRLRLHLSNRGKGYAPAELTFLFAGGAFGSTYNDAYLPIDVPVPADAQRVELWSLITGHGGETNNCAEFCNHQHELTVNGHSYLKEHPEAATNDGCIAELEHGMVPNQPGTWWFGRGGWCPGQQVDPWVVDVTADVTPGQTAQITYQGMYAGGTPPDGSGNIVMTSYLVVYR